MKSYCFGHVGGLIREDPPSCLWCFERTPSASKVCPSLCLVCVLGHLASPRRLCLKSSSRAGENHCSGWRCQVPRFCDTGLPCVALMSSAQPCEGQQGSFLRRRQGCYDRERSRAHSFWGASLAMLAAAPDPHRQLFTSRRK